MSIFGQVWVFSAASFVLGAFLAWLFLVRPMRRRNRELERRLSAIEASRPAAAEADRGTGTRPAGGRTPAPGDEESDAPARSTRRFVPAEATPEPEPTEATRHIAPAPNWPERDSLAGRRPAPGAGPGPDPDHADEFAELDAAFAEDEPAPDPDGPTRFAPRRGDELGPAGHPADQDTQVVRRGASLFEPAEFADAGPPDGTGADHDDRTTETPPAYAFGGGPGPDTTEEEHPPADRTQMLPKRRPGQSSLESFEQPKPIQPSMRPVDRREPQGGAAGARSGSLFEPATPAPGPATPARDESEPGEPSPGPFGPGSAMPRPGGGRPSDDYTVKASVTALRYCAEGSPEFPKMVAEVWFRTPDDAERVGFRPLNP